MAIVYLGQTVVFVDVPDSGPYNTRKGIEMVVRALQPRVPAHGATGSNK